MAHTKIKQDFSQGNLQVIVQAGGRGSRLRHHTWNKPKCLVAINGKPILYHLFSRFPNANFHIIGDYGYEILDSYLKVNNPSVLFRTVKVCEKGTAAGIADCLDQINPDDPILLTWSDLLIGDLPDVPNSSAPVVFTTSAFTCRWSVTNEGFLREIPSDKTGVAGLFYFAKASYFPKPPRHGEFVKWFSRNIENFKTIDCPDLSELGDFHSIELSNERDGFSRYFNNVEIREADVIKTVVVKEFEDLHQKEVDWYKHAAELGFTRIPEIYSTTPLIMQRIQGQHAYDMLDLTDREKGAVIIDYLESLSSLHSKTSIPADPADIESAYVTKTIDRVSDISLIIPHYEKSSITINGKKCFNPFSKDPQTYFKELLNFLFTDQFTPIHGDPTFSNSLVDKRLKVWFIDPRGYFIKPGITGDPWYDFAKVYYSAVGGYDSFNRRRFKLYVDEETVEIIFESPIFKSVTSEIFSEYFGKNLQRIKLLHAIIWLSLSGYAKDDIDSAIGAFYQGLYWLESATAHEI